MKRKRTVVVIPADTHSGSLGGLMLPVPWNVEGGGTYHPNEMQKTIAAQWAEGWEQVRDLRKGARLVVIHNGDAIEGNHHTTTEIISKRTDEHEGLHIAAMDWALKTAKFGKGDLLYYTRGTDSHVGKSEDRIASDLGAVPFIAGTPDQQYKDAKHAWPHLTIRIDDCLFDIGHKGWNPGNRIWTQGNGLNYTARDVYFRCLEYSQPMPRFVIGAQYHQYGRGRFDGEHGTIEVISLPCFQAKSEWAHQAARNKLTHIGLWWVILEEGQEPEPGMARIMVGNKVVEV